MKYEDKELLFKDLCARLPYRVIVKLDDKFKFDRGDKVLVKELLDLYCMDGIKPYLRPMSSMTEEEKKEFDYFCVIDEFAWAGNSEIGYRNQAIIMSDGIDYLNSIYVDYRGLIPMGLALEAPKDMYKL